MVAPTTRRTKYNATRTHLPEVDRWFDSKVEATRAEELLKLQREGAITDLSFQPKWTLSEYPKVTYAADFRYLDPRTLVNIADGPRMTREPTVVYEDVKGMLTRDTKTKLAWLRSITGIEVRLVTFKKGAFVEVPWMGKPNIQRAPRKKKIMEEARGGTKAL